MKKKNKVTMTDIAQNAGVSQATVSLVLNQSKNIRLSDDTRRRVLDSAINLGYSKLPTHHYPDSKGHIALLINSLPVYDPFVCALQEAQEAAWSNDILLTIYDYIDDVELIKRIIYELNQSSCQGIIVASCITRVFDFKPFSKALAPVVLLNNYDPAFPRLPVFLPDDRGNAYQVTQHLIEQGAQRIALITGESWMEASIERLGGYTDALNYVGRMIDPELIISANWSIEQAYTATLKLINLKSPPDAIFCCSDWMVIGCYQALAQSGVNVPLDILVAGYDDFKISKQLTPKLSSIKLPYAELGKMAVEYLCKKENTATQVRMAGKLKIRDSTTINPSIRN
ncbi:transcriptional regulator [Gammaproteobacteria bacterium]|nr:transcriptional regulator [Gammaproteobacteria bacterium]